MSAVLSYSTMTAFLYAVDTDSFFTAHSYCLSLSLCLFIRLCIPSPPVARHMFPVCFVYDYSGRGRRVWAGLHFFFRHEHRAKIPVNHPSVCQHILNPCYLSDRPGAHQWVNLRVGQCQPTHFNDASMISVHGIQKSCCCRRNREQNWCNGAWLESSKSLHHHIHFDF